MAKKIVVPKTPRSAYNPDRKISKLLKAHVLNLEASVRRRHGVQVIAAKKPRTERQASAYIAALTECLHPNVSPALIDSSSGLPELATDQTKTATRTRRRRSKGPAPVHKAARNPKTKRARRAKK